MVLKEMKKVYLGSKAIKKIYAGAKLVFSLVTPAPPLVSEDTLAGSNSAEDYVEGSTSWGNLTLSSGCEISKDGIEIQNDETYVSASISGISYPMTFEFKARIDSSSYRQQDSGPAMLFGLSPTADTWGSGITCYCTTDYGIIVDTTGAMKIVTNVTPMYAHIIFTIDSSGALTLYINGINNSWTYSGDTATKSNKTYVYNGEGIGRFVGAINVMRWWNSMLSTEEIEELFSADSFEYTLDN